MKLNSLLAFFAVLWSLFLIPQWAQAHSVEHIVQVSGGQTTPEQAKRIVVAVHRESKRQGLSPDFVFRLIQVESTFKIRARSHENAQGLTQVIPRWHRTKIDGRNLYDIDVNIEVGTKVIREYLNQCRESMPCAMRKYNGSSGNKYYASIRNVKMAGRPDLISIEEYPFLGWNAVAINSIAENYNH